MSLKEELGKIQDQLEELQLDLAVSELANADAFIAYLNAERDQCKENILSMNMSDMAGAQDFVLRFARARERLSYMDILCKRLATCQDKAVELQQNREALLKRQAAIEKRETSHADIF